MRHRNAGRKLGRNHSHRKALMMNLCNALIERELIKTTLAKAKEMRGYIEPLVTRAKLDSVSNRRIAFSRLRSRDAVTKLFMDLGIRFSTRPGGYVRVIKCGYRAGDAAPMAIIEFIERKALDVVQEKKSSKTKTVSKSKKSLSPTEEVTQSIVAEAVDINSEGHANVAPDK